MGFTLIFYRFKTKGRELAAKIHSQNNKSKKNVRFLTIYRKKMIIYLTESQYAMLSESKCTKATKKTSSDRDGKKWMQCVKKTDGEGYKRVHWGDPNAKVTGDSGNTKRKKTFRARHDCKNAKPATPKYMACKDW
jgi:hypothetical protein